MAATVRVIDETGRYGPTELLARNMGAAFDAWGLAPSAGTVDIDLILTTGSSVPRANGGPTGAVSIGTDGSLAIADGTAAFELRTGRDTNGPTADITVTLNVDFAATWYWVNPLDGASAPGGRTDMVSVFAHELGHALGIVGYRDWGTYQLSGGFETPFDVLILLDPQGPFFVGQNAMALYGGPVPLTGGNLYHVGNQGALGGQLSADVMNGWVMPFGTTPVSGLDMAILSDVGVPTAFGDRLDGSSSADTMNGGGGADSMRGMDGADAVNGATGDDDVNGNVGQDLVWGGEGNDVVRGGKDNDTVYGESGDDPHVNGNIGNDLVFGGVGHDTLFGGQDSDTLNGEDGNDWLSGDLGDDVLVGGFGADRFLFRTGSGADWVSDFNSAAGDRVQLAPGLAYVLTSQDGQVVIDLGSGDRLGLTGVAAGSLGDWLVFA